MSISRFGEHLRPVSNLQARRCCERNGFEEEGLIEVALTPAPSHQNGRVCKPRDRRRDSPY